MVGSSRMAISACLTSSFGQAEALAHAVREGCDAAIGDIGQADALQRPVDALVRLVGYEAREPRRVGEIFVRRQVIVEADLVRQIANPPLDRQRLAERVEAENAHRAAQWAR